MKYRISIKRLFEQTDFAVVPIRRRVARHVVQHAFLKHLELPLLLHAKKQSVVKEDTSSEKGSFPLREHLCKTTHFNACDMFTIYYSIVNIGQERIDHPLLISLVHGDQNQNIIVHSAMS